MIEKIRIAGYKCLREVSLETSNLNIFAGPNSSGKSSTIQVLLLLRQSTLDDQKIPSLNLSGELYEGGTAADILHPESNYRIGCEFLTGSANFGYEFQWIRSSDANQHSRSLSSVESSAPKLLRELAGPDFIYLNAERSRPKVSFELPSDRIGAAGILGKHGEFTAARLARASFGQNVIDWQLPDGLQERLKVAPLRLDSLQISDELSKSEGRIDLVTKQMLNWIMPGAYFDATEVAATDTAILEYLRDRAKASAKVRPTHMGFGLTYALPVIAAGFFAPPGATIIVENPEAHLHPYSQSRLGVLLALVAASGRQVFVETHSDHVVNGVRVAVAHKLIDSSLVRTHFFRPPLQGTTADVVSIACDTNGRMDKWPAGFFDQIESDLSKI